MSNLLKYIVSALLIIVAVACHTSEIDNPNNDNPDKPKISNNVKLTASIKQTRVSYTANDVDNILVTNWEKDDVIFGYYGSGNGSKIVFTVTNVDESTGIASLEAKDDNEWKGFLAQLQEYGEDLPVGLLYTGTKVTDEDILFANGNSVSIDMTSQTGKDIPACMHSCFFELKEKNETQTVLFSFVNDCAIFEIESLTGIAEDAGLANGQTLALKSLAITNLIPSYEYSYADGEIDFRSGSGALTSYNVDLTNSSWTVNKDGAINRSYDNNLLVAVSSNPTEKEILISATTADNRKFSYLYKGGLLPGQCYRIKKKDVVAKTADGQYFTTVNGAFDHAAKLYQPTVDPYVSAENNTVTLVRNCGLGGVNGNGEPIEGSKVYIENYNASLDLNGHTLTLFNCGFLVNNNKDDGDDASDTFIIDDSNTNGNGTIVCKDFDPKGCHLVDNYGTVKINGGNLTHNADWCAVRNREGATLTVDGGKLVSGGYHTIVNDGELTISNGVICGNSSDYTIYNSGHVSVTGGKVSTQYAYTIYCDGGSIDMSGGEVSCTFDKAGALLLDNAPISSISGGILKSSGKCTVSMMNASTLNVSGGKIICTSTDKNISDISAAAIQCSANGTDGLGNPILTIKWPDDVTDQPEDVYEPLLYSKSDTPIAEMSSNDTENPRYCTVTIQGGFLYTLNGSAFFRQKGSSSLYKPLQIGSGCYFFSNKSDMTGVGNVGMSIKLDTAETIEYEDLDISEITNDLVFNNYITITQK